jgi:hypothetical protein
MSWGDPMDVVVWLRGLGLGRYEAAFRENEIDDTVLPHLTAEDLKDLGVCMLAPPQASRCYCCRRTGVPASADAATSRVPSVFRKTTPNAAKLR